MTDTHGSHNDKSVYLFSEYIDQMPKDKLEKTRQWFKKFARTFPPYNFTVNYAKNVGLCTEDSDAANFGRKFAMILSLESNQDVNQELRLIELEKDLVPLVESTGNDVFYRPLFFPSIFINNDFYFEDLVVKGIFITECYTQEGTHKYTLRHPEPNDYAIFIVSVDLVQGCEFYANIALINDIIGARYTDTKEESDRIKRLSIHIRTMICNIIDMVEGNKEDLDVTIIESSKEQNIKRIKKGQISYPTKVFIRARKEFKKYVKKFNDDSEKRKISHKFLVRGHWRHYLNEKYVNVCGEKKWIKPFYKGEGILIKKDYKIK